MEVGKGEGEWRDHRPTTNSWIRLDMPQISTAACADGPMRRVASTHRAVYKGIQGSFFNYYAAFNAPCVGHKDDESQARGSRGSTRSN